MAFQFSHEFHRNWLAAPKAERSRIKQDLSAIVDLLKPDTDLSSWQKKHGMYEKNAFMAEQVSLFDQPAEATSQPVNDDLTATNDVTDTSPTSDFLKKVFQDTEASSPRQVNPMPHADTENTSPSSLSSADIEKITAALQPDIESYIRQAMTELKAEIVSLFEGRARQD